jgi:hypothetical protein
MRRELMYIFCGSFKNRKNWVRKLYRKSLLKSNKRLINPQIFWFTICGIYLWPANLCIEDTQILFLRGLSQGRQDVRMLFIVTQPLTWTAVEVHITVSSCILASCCVNTQDQICHLYPPFRPRGVNRWSEKRDNLINPPGGDAKIRQNTRSHDVEATHDRTSTCTWSLRSLSSYSGHMIFQTGYSKYSSSASPRAAKPHKDFSTRWNKKIPTKVRSNARF